MQAGKVEATGERDGTAPGLAAMLEDARRAGLLDGGRTVRVSFRAPPALVEVAKLGAGVEPVTELGVRLAMLARPDPVGTFTRRSRGRLGASHTLEYQSFRPRGVLFDAGARSALGVPKPVLG
jgi:hypothetical protein